MPIHMPIQTLETPVRTVPFEPVTFPPIALLYKHSPICPISSHAMTEVQTFAQDHEDIPVLMVDVLGQQSLSRQLAAQLGVAHESPQLIVLKDGKAVWTRSGMRIRLDAIERAVESV
jgi:bacillithiol system protein YtxJ